MAVGYSEGSLTVESTPLSSFMELSLILDMVSECDKSKSGCAVEEEENGEEKGEEKERER